MRLIVATSNKFKLKEIRKILKEVRLPIVSLADLDKKFRIVENDKTFEGNAKKKALPVSKCYKDDFVLGEDSGLEVDYLDGAPGVCSKRYAGPSGDQIKNNKKLLNNLRGVPFKKRGAHFVCCLVLAHKGEVTKVFQGKLRGIISIKESGNNGFGYDPVFYLAKYKKTVGQLPQGEKNKISHRAKAFGKLKLYLEGRR